MSEEELAIYVKEDLENIGMTNVIIQDSIPELIYDNQELICLRVKDEDYHFMRYDKKTNAWYHKPGNSAILRYKYIPSNGLPWKSELFSFNKARFGNKSYNSNIKFIIYTKPYVVVNCKANNMQTDFHLRDGKDVLIEMNITCDSTFYFDVDIDIDREICVFLFDHDFNQLIARTSGEGKYSYFFNFKNSGTYYLRVSSNNQATSSNQNIPFILTITSSKIYDLKHELTEGSNFLLCHSHKEFSDNYYIETYYKSNGAGYYKLSLNVLKNDQRITLSEGAMTIYNSDNELEEYKYNVFGNREKAENKDNLNYMYIYLTGETYCVRIELPDNNYQSIEIIIEFVENKNIDIESRMSEEFVDNIFNSNAYEYAQKFQTKVPIVAKIEGNINYEINYSINVILFGIVLKNNQYSIDSKLYKQFNKDCKSINTEIVLEPGYYFLAYYNNKSKIPIQINLKRIINHYNSNIISCDPGNGYTFGSEVRYNNGEYNGNTITEGFTRHLYFVGEHNEVPSFSRIQYKWYSSNDNIASVSTYGTVLAKKVIIDNDIVIYAIYNNDYSIIFGKSLQIIKDENHDPIIIIQNKILNYSSDEIYQLELDDENSPYPWIKYYDLVLTVPEEEPLNGAYISEYGLIHKSGLGLVTVTANYKLNNRITIIIGVNIV